MQVFERSKITVWKRHIFQKENCYWSFRYVSTICRKVVSEAPVKCSFVFSWNNSDSFVFRNTAFGEIKDHILKKTAFSNKLYWSFRYMSVLHKKVFSRAPVKWFSLCGSYNSGSVFFQESWFWRDQGPQFEKDTFSEKKKKMLFEVLRMCLPYIKGYFQDQEWSAFLFIAQMT